MQEWIHFFEEGEGARWMGAFSIAIILFAIAVAYNLREFQSPRAPDAMDAAQVARNLADGHGFTTLHIRPVTIGLLRNHREDKDALLKSTDPANPAAVTHPDLANPPVYPLLLAGLMQVVPFNWDIPVGRAESHWRFGPDQIIALMNQLWFVVMLLQAFFITRRLIHRGAAWLVLLGLFGTDLLWRFSVSGLSTNFLCVVLLGIVQLLLGMEERARATPPASTASLAWRAVLVAVLVGIGFLTRYSFGFLLVPVLVFFLSCFSGRRAVLVTAAVLAFAAVSTPWLVRNYEVSGTLFGVPGFAWASQTDSFPALQIERQFQPDLNRVDQAQLARKFGTGLKALFTEQLPTLGGTWLVAFFFVGLAVRFVTPGLARLRAFTVVSLVVLAVVQCAGRTHLTDMTPVVNSENLLVLLTPLIAIAAVALFFTFLDNTELPHPLLRYPIGAAFLIVTVAPLIVTFLPPRTFPVAYPPYYPPFLKRVAQYFDPDELIMTDQPWAMAWYGRRQAVLLTRNPEDEFLALSDWIKPVRGLYLTSLTLDQRFTSELVLKERDWGRFVISCLVQGVVPGGFPLRRSPAGFLPEHFLLADRERWTEGRGGNP
ncbi:MAG: ArnT family glycosyltransferase [Limisphaerales bacterium]